MRRLTLPVLVLPLATAALLLIVLRLPTATISGTDTPGTPAAHPSTLRAVVALSQSEPSTAPAPELERQPLIEEVAPATRPSLLVRVTSGTERNPAPGVPFVVRSLAGGTLPEHVRVTGADGSCAIADLDPGTYDVVVDVHTRKQVAVAGDGDVLVEFHMEDVLQVDGIVVDEHGDPVPGADVLAIHHPDWPMPTHQVRVAVSDAEGRFALVRRDAAWWYAARKAERVSPLVHPGGGDGEDIGTGRAHLRLVAEPAPVQVVGRVFTSAGEPVAGAQILLLGTRVRGNQGLAMERAVAPAQSAADGSFRVHARAAGVAELIVRGAGHAPLYLELQLPAMGNVSIDPVLRRGVTLSGTVRDERGQPVAGAELSLYLARRMDACAQARSVADGTFVLANLPPGPGSTLHAKHEAHERAQQRLAVLDADVRVDLELQRSAQIHGRLLRGDGSPLAGWRIERRIHGAREPVGLLTTGTDGSFVVGASPGTPLQLYAMHPRLTLRIPLAEGRTLTPQGESREDFAIPEHEMPTASIRGRLVGADGEPIGNASVYVFDGRTRAHDRRRIGADGTFVLGPLPPRSYRLMTRLRDGGERDLLQLALAAGQVADLGVVRVH
jgi:hypothetical protein